MMKTLQVFLIITLLNSTTLDCGLLDGLLVNFFLLHFLLHFEINWSSFRLSCSSVYKYEWWTTYGYLVISVLSWPLNARWAPQSILSKLVLMTAPLDLMVVSVLSRNLTDLGKLYQPVISFRYHELPCKLNIDYHESLNSWQLSQWLTICLWYCSQSGWCSFGNNCLLIRVSCLHTIITVPIETPLQWFFFYFLLYTLQICQTCVQSKWGTTLLMMYFFNLVLPWEVVFVVK